MKEHLKKHKIKEQHKKKHYWLLCDMNNGYFRSHSGGKILFTSHMDKTKKFNTQKEASEYLDKVRGLTHLSSWLIVGHSKNKLIQTLGDYINRRTYE